MNEWDTVINIQVFEHDQSTFVKPPGKQDFFLVPLPIQLPFIQGLTVLTNKKHDIFNTIYFDNKGCVYT